MSAATDIEVGLDNTVAILAVSPELNELLMRAKAIYANLGGKVAATSMESAKSFDGKRLIVVAQMRALDRLLDTRNMSGIERMHKIRINNQCRRQLNDIQQCIVELVKVHHNELKSKAGVSDEERVARQQAFKDMQTELSDLKDKLSGVQRRRGGGGAGGAVEMQDVTGFINGKSGSGSGGGAASGAGSGGGFNGEGGSGGGGFGGSGSNTVEEDLTQTQIQEIGELDAIRVKQDELLEEIGKEADILLEQALGFKDEMDKQDALIGDLEKKISKASDKLKKVNDQADRAVEMVNAPSTSLCMYAICFIVLLGIVTVGYNVINSN